VNRYGTSNLGRRSRDGWPWGFLLCSSAPMKQGSGVAPLPTARRARTWPILLQILNGFFLRYLDEERNLFCILTTTESNGGRLAMVA
jgi:hypothetical protein